MSPQLPVFQFAARFYISQASFHRLDVVVASDRKC